MASRARAAGSGTGSLLLIAVAAAVVPARAAIHEIYTTNAVCMTRYCINPVFPALAELPALRAKTWSKHSLANVSNLMSFCGQIVDYDIALPVSDSSGSNLLERSRSLAQRFSQGGVVTDSEAMASKDPVKEAVLHADRSAARQYFFHLQGMGLEAWDHVDPMGESSNPLRPCAQTVARLVCHTFFPQAPSFVSEGEDVEYLTPCKSSCQSYVDTCGVSCCDEGVTCSWDAAHGDSPVKTQGVGGQEVLLQTGYASSHGSSSLSCTGASSSAPAQSSAANFFLLFAATLALPSALGA